MKRYKSASTTHFNRGFALAEIMLGLVIIGTALVMYFSFYTRQVSISDGRAKAGEMEAVGLVFERYFSANRISILDAMAATDASDENVQSHCVIKVTDKLATINPGLVPGDAGANGTLAWSGGDGINVGKKTCAFDLSFLQAKGFWPKERNITHRTEQTGGLWRYAAIFKRVKGTGPDGVLGTADDALNDDVEMILVKMQESVMVGTVEVKSIPALTPKVWQEDKPLRDREMAAMSSLGWSGGILPIGNNGGCSAIKSSVNVCGDAWKVDLADWIDPDEFNSLVDVLPLN